APTPSAIAARTDAPGALEDALSRAREHFRQGDFEAAARAYKHAARIAPRNPLIFAGLGAARMRVGDRRGAMEAYERAVALAPSNEHYRTTLARLQ
ncbi:MAG: tetratricopeptide repeat protein, partial [Myxococcales bacterium]|nr:tetratricopeptide repeat protein [Myxococcales bacterium]